MNVSSFNLLEELTEALRKNDSQVDMVLAVLENGKTMNREVVDVGSALVLDVIAICPHGSASQD